MKPFILFLTLLLGMLVNATAQCLKTDAKELKSIIVYSSTGNAELDKTLNAEKARLEAVYKIKVDLKIMDDSQSPNALATPQSTNPYFFHGTVYLGKTLLSNELNKGEKGIYAVVGIMAHEFAHILQATLDCQLETSFRELHADFLAGYYVAVRGGYENEAELTAFGQSLYEKGDSELWDAAHHGTPAQRLQAMLAGYKMSEKIKTPKEAYNLGVTILTNGGDKGELGSQETTNTEAATPSVNEPEPRKQPQKPRQTPNKPNQQTQQTVQFAAVTLSDGVRYNESYAIEFTYNDIKYSGMLVLNNNVGKMRLYYIHQSCGKEHLVEQRMTVKTTANGLNIIGSDPFDVNEGDGNTDYVADNFYVIKTQSGNVEVWNIDVKGNKAQVNLTPLTTEKEATWWLEDVKWD